MGADSAGEGSWGGGGKVGWRQWGAGCGASGRGGSQGSCRGAGSGEVKQSLPPYLPSCA